ncbi:MAG TPA: DUF4142 domain-containing protein [Sphingobacterium sp.]|nr:DUF4142 domain-containing protein [Sphingobacterium sp.]
MKGRIKKTIIIIGVLLFFFTNVFAQQMEFNDPQIISVVEAISKIDMDYGEIALNRTQNNEVKEFAQAMIQNYTYHFNQILALKKELILSIQTNEITRSLLKDKSENIKLLESRKQKYFDITYVDNEVAFHEAAVSILKNVLIPQARNDKLKNFLAKISPSWEQDLKTAKKIQDEINK